MLDWGTSASTILSIVLLAVLAIRAVLLWADNRRQRR
jgi:hypothetical protein